MKNVFKLFGIIALVFGLVLLGCNNGNGTTGNEFTASTNETVSNDVDTLGFIGTSVSSNKPNVATAEIVSGKIKITSVAEGTAVITVSAGSSTATINISISKTGSITVEAITKFNPFKGTWVGTDGWVQPITIIFDDTTYEGESIGDMWYKSKGTYTFNGNNAQIIQTDMDFGSGWTKDGSPFALTLPMNMSFTIIGNKITFPDDSGSITKQH
jgi:hypothetical protein